MDYTLVFELSFLVALAVFFGGFALIGLCVAATTFALEWYKTTVCFLVLTGLCSSLTAFFIAYVAYSPIK